MVVHLIEANFVAPVVMERQVNLPPVITIAGVLLIGKLFGLGGLIIAVPILALVMILVRHILLGEVYGDPISASPRRRAPSPPMPSRPSNLRTPDRMTAPRFLIVADGDFAPMTSKTANSVIRYLPDRTVGVLDRQQAGKTVQDVLGFGGAHSGRGLDAGGARAAGRPRC